MAGEAHQTVQRLRVRVLYVVDADRQRGAGGEAFEGAADVLHRHGADGGAGGVLGGGVVQQLLQYAEGLPVVRGKPGGTQDGEAGGGGGVQCLAQERTLSTAHSALGDEQFHRAGRAFGKGQPQRAELCFPVDEREFFWFPRGVQTGNSLHDVLISPFSKKACLGDFDCLSKSGRGRAGWVDQHQR
ncbi:hypothetical protein SAV14893_085040 [Streptomyces avermitilis]|uniref:Uncharacterized protein n=1 Tax=Streptomyces avermitilis TaxID=33903 RepID=A0A4D4MAV9_STRAX|nr:hypothetical protein [Streptomyces avermitilis]GDY69111.1 hypothetical protein SAV14893_085040 [Streptomyces avermitilis]